MSLDPAGSGQFALDMQGLQRLKHSARQDPAQGVRGAAEQFEALFIQMMLKSMRDAVPTTGLVDGQQTAFYQSMLDQQWSQTLASRGMGLADSLVAQLERSGMVAPPPQSGSEVDALIAGIPRGTPRPLQDALRPAAEDSPDAASRAGNADEASAPSAAPPADFLEAVAATSAAPAPGFMDQLAAQAAPRAALDPSSDRPAAAPAAAAVEPARGAQRPRDDAPDHVQAFLDRLSASAQAASRKTGVPAELILAQAALETGWGRHEIATADGGNSHNLFGIKAGSQWQGPTTEIVTHEVLNGQRTRIRDSFRVYGSFEEAFTDYARLIGDNPRYAKVTSAPSAAQAARELQSGGYATDPAYADKLIAVMDSLGPQSPGNEALVFLRY